MTVTDQTMCDTLWILYCTIMIQLHYQKWRGRSREIGEQTNKAAVENLYKTWDLPLNLLFFHFLSLLLSFLCLLLLFLLFLFFLLLLFLTATFRITGWLTMTGWVVRRHSHFLLFLLLFFLSLVTENQEYIYSTSRQNSCSANKLSLYRNQKLTGVTRNGILTTEINTILL